MDELKRVLVATDGSERARVALELVAAMRLAEGATVEVLDVYDTLMQGIEVPPETLAALERDLRDGIDEHLADAKERLARPGVSVATAMRRGRAPTEIVREAERIGSELVVVGSRGRGPIATMLLGSVASEVVDRSPCPVLVARRPELRRMVVADDGSAASALAVKAACRWSMFKGLDARVVSVAPVYAFTGFGPVRHEDAERSYAEGVEALRGIHGLIARDAAKELSDSGVPAAPDVRFGDPAQEIIEAAIESEADLIVMGSRGQTGLERIVVGSVARNVLTHAPVSVLIVHR